MFNRQFAPEESRHGFGPVGSPLYTQPTPHVSIADGMGMLVYKVAEGEPVDVQLVCEEV